jgi:bifunctional N-acetylglucosamine-1-phosphate-uridyltransferase/glucosamine-1-phosphate-acetyltransferase GlmU-like protein
MAPLTLVVLAAGLGKRYGGGIKQLAPVGPAGETLLEYTSYDAARAGFTRAVLVVRPGIEPPRVGGLEVAVALQTEPLGTAHALLAAEGVVSGPMAVANADDFYGREAIAAMARFLGEGTDAWAVAGYKLKDTLSPEGGVSRAILRTDEGAWLTDIEERRNITSGGDEPVSMNLWAFTPRVFDVLRAFMRGPRAGEYILPDAVAEAVSARKARVKVLPAGSRWMGITHSGDRARVAGEMAALVAAGTYPSPLWP